MTRGEINFYPLPRPPALRRLNKILLFCSLKNVIERLVGKNLQGQSKGCESKRERRESRARFEFSRSRRYLQKRALGSLALEIHSAQVLSSLKTRILFRARTSAKNHVCALHSPCAAAAGVSSKFSVSINIYIYNICRYMRDRYSLSRARLHHAEWG